MPNTGPECSEVPDKTPIHVVAAVIYDNHNRDRILISKRPEHVHQGGLWEFPGGKVDLGETAYQALLRELLEELDIEVTEARPLMQISHNYADKQVFLDIWSVLSFTGQARGVEGQECRWLSLRELLLEGADYQFPEANRPILEKLRSLIDPLTDQTSSSN